MDNTLKSYTLEEVKEELIENKELYEFKLKLCLIWKASHTKPKDKQFEFLSKKFIHF